MIDYTKLLNKLSPPDDGEDPLRIRSMTVTAINSNGTVTLSSGGSSIPQVPRLSGAFVAVGSAAQVLVHRGSLLVLGTSGGGSAPTTVSSTSTVNVTSTSSWASSGTGLVFVAARDSATVQIFDFLVIASTSSAGRSISASTEVRTGGTVGSGSVVASPTTAERATIISDQALAMRATASWSRPVSGLTPGAVYNVRIMHQINSSSGLTASSSQRSITVIP